MLENLAKLAMMESLLTVSTYILQRHLTMLAMGYLNDSKKKIRQKRTSIATDLIFPMNGQQMIASTTANYLRVT